MSNEETLNLPDDLTALWDHFNQSPDAISEQEAVRLFYNLVARLASAIRFMMLPDLGDEEAINDLVENFILGNESKSIPEMKIGLLRKPRQYVEAKTKLSHLTNDIKKLWAQINNPCGYKLSQQIDRAIRELEKEGKVIRDSDSKGKYLSKMTKLNLPENPDQDSTFDNYQKNAWKIPFYKPKMRGGTVEHSLIITLKDAKKLILKLLEAFEGWTSLGNIKCAAKKHTRHFEIKKALDMFPGETDEEKVLDEKSFDNGFNESESGNDYAEDFYLLQGQNIVLKNSEQIWAKVCEVTEGYKLFCLYFIPNQFTDYRTAESPQMSLEDFGSPSTIGDRNKRLEEIWKSEFRELKSSRVNCYSESQHRQVNEIAMEILINLLHRCTEIGCNPHLNI